MKRSNTDILLVVFLVLIAASSRIINAKLGVPNFVPLVALSLFSGAVVNERKWLAFLVPVFGQMLGDVFFQAFTLTPGFYSWVGMPFNYGGLVLATVIGQGMKVKPINVLAYTFGASTLFFLVSNLGYFLEGWNTITMHGLVKTYADAVPFFKNSFTADIVGSVLTFGGYFLVQQALLKKTEKAKI